MKVTFRRGNSNVSIKVSNGPTLLGQIRHHGIGTNLWVYLSSDCQLQSKTRVGVERQVRDYYRSK